MIFGPDARHWYFTMAGSGGQIRGPIYEDVGAFLVVSGAHNNYWLVDERFSTELWSTFAAPAREEELWAHGFKLARNNVYTPARLAGPWYVLKNTFLNIVSPLQVRLVTWRDPVLPWVR